MVFVTVGSQRFPFDRLVKSVDDLVARGVITEEVFAQIGWSDYEPQHFAYERLMDREDFARRIDECSVLIAHGGTGVIVSALSTGKRVVAMPRLAKYGEHVDDHQLQILGELGEAGLIQIAETEDDLECAYLLAKAAGPAMYQSTTHVFLADLDTYLAHL